MTKPSAKKFTYDKDSGYAELATRFKGSKGGYSVFVGWLQSSGMHRGTGTPMTVANIGAIAEFGAEIKNGFGRGIPISIPPRHALSSAIDNNDSVITGVLKKLTAGVIDGKESETSALGKLGQKVVDLIRDNFTKGLQPPLSPNTIKRKGPEKSKPFIDTGQLVGAVSFEVRKNR